MPDALTFSMKDRVEKVKFTEQALSFQNAYCKILKISSGDYILQRPFLRGSFLEGFIFGGAYLLMEICVSQSIGLAL